MLLRLAPRCALSRLELDSAELGLVGERVAERALLRDGWRVLGRRVQTPAGEVDLVALDADGRPVAVEVKTGRVPSLEPLPDPLLRPARRLDWRALERRRQAAGFLSSHLEPGSLRGARVRVDLVEVLVSPRGGLRVLHHRDLHQPPVVLPGPLRGPSRGPS